MKIIIDKWQIRSFTEKDIPALVKYANNPRVSLNLRDGFPYPYTRRDAEEWIRKVKTEKPVTNFAFANTLELIGGIGLLPNADVHRKSAELGYWLGEPFWGQGIATRAVRAFIPYAFENFDLIRIYAFVFESNPASARVLEKCGFTYEGRLRQSVVKRGKILDMHLYSILKHEVPKLKNHKQN